MNDPIIRLLGIAQSLNKSVTPKEYVEKILEFVEECLPELYGQHIRRRRNEFIRENAPLAEYDLPGKRFGYVSKDLRMLWALQKMLHQSSLAKRTPPAGVNRDVWVICQILNDIIRSLLGNLCDITFWYFVERRFEEAPKWHGVKRRLSLRSDWSIFVIAPVSTPGDERGIPETLLMAAYSLGAMSQLIRNVLMSVESNKT